MRICNDHLMDASGWRAWLPSWLGELAPAAWLVFFPLAPLLASMVLGWNRMSFGLRMPRLASTLYWAGLVCAIWAAASIGTLLVLMLLRRRRWCWPPWSAALLGALLGVVLFYWPIASYRNLGWSMLPGDMALDGPPLPWPTLEYLPRLAANTLPGILFWTVTVWIISRMRRPATAAGAVGGAGQDNVRNPDAEAQPPDADIRARLPAHLDGEVLALKAEDHYVRVYTEKGDTLIHHRFRDAVAALEGADGLQVHRSFWVRRSAIMHRYNKGHGQFLQLANDLQVPVSRPYRPILRDVRLLAPPAEEGG